MQKTNREIMDEIREITKKRLDDSLSDEERFVVEAQIDSLKEVLKTRIDFFVVNWAAGVRCVRPILMWSDPEYFGK